MNTIILFLQHFLFMARNTNYMLNGEERIPWSLIYTVWYRTII